MDRQVDRRVEEAIQMLRKDLKTLACYMMRRSTMLFGGVFMSLPVHAVPHYGTAATNGKRIFIDPLWWAKLDRAQKRLVIFHEVGHVILNHPFRSARLIKALKGVNGWPAVGVSKVANWFADAKVHQIIEELDRSLIEPLRNDIITPQKAARALGVSVGEFKKMALEEAVHRYIKNNPPPQVIYGDFPTPQHPFKQPDHPPDVIIVTPPPPIRTPPCDEEGHPSDEEGGEGRETREEQGAAGDDEREFVEGNDVLNPDTDLGGEEVKEGEEDIKSEQDVERIVKRALVTAKQAGSVPGGLILMIDKAFPPRVNWRSLLRSSIVAGLGDDVKRTWARPSRKLGWDFPGKMTLGLDTVWVLMDTSGSIGVDELRQFLGEIIGIARSYRARRIVLVEWDAAVQRIEEVRTVPNKIEVRGGGGTRIIPALKAVIDKVKPGDIVVILSDWHIWDLYNAIPLLESLASKAAKMFCVTTSAEPPDIRNAVNIRIPLSSLY